MEDANFISDRRPSHKFGICIFLSVTMQNARHLSAVSLGKTLRCIEGKPASFLRSYESATARAGRCPLT